MLSKLDHARRPSRPAAFLLPWSLLFIFCLLWGASARANPVALEAGVYQTADGLTICRLAPQADGSWEMLLQEGGPGAKTGAGFAFLGRLLPKPGTNRLAGSWLAMPGSCCPGRGRGEIEILGPDSFRFASFTPSLDRPSWPVPPGREFHRTGEAPRPSPLERLVGAWRLGMWYTDLLPNQRPADPVQGELVIQAKDGAPVGTWRGRPAPVKLALDDQGLKLTYRDPAAGFDLAASLRESAGGLALVGPFSSTLGRGRLTLVRAGAPALPPGPAAGGGDDLSGVWVDPRTGADFFKIKGSRRGFDFTAYGGSPAQPRYLSRGRARPREPGRLAGEARDVEGYCCGNQGRFVFRVLDRDRLEVSSFWWPLGRPDPGTQPGEPFVIQRVKQDESAPSPAQAAGGWPLVRASLPGLLPAEGGAVKAVFTWRPDREPRVYTIFSQGGYLRDMDLFIDPQGHLGARLACAQGEAAPLSRVKVSPDQPHTVWLVYQQAEGVKLFLDGQEAAAAAMPGPWNASRSPYLTGASRWPGRDFAGDIERVELFASPQDPQQPTEPDITITPPPRAAPESPESGAQKVRLVPLIRLWLPGRLVHAYAADPREVDRLVSAGFERQGALGSLWSGPEPGAVPLRAYRRRDRGYIILSTAASPPPGCDALGELGRIQPQPGPGLAPLYELKAVFPEPLRGGRSEDILYTSSKETAAQAQKAGYGRPRVIGYLKPGQEPPFQPPALYTWSGAWQGEGWGRFFLARRGRELTMFWFYSRINGPHYFGRYQLSPDGRTARGYAVGRPGPGATYYQHTLTFDVDAAQGPVIRLTAKRLAAPMDDGRLVVFKNPKSTQALLRKTGRPLEPAEAAALRKAMTEIHPQRMLQEASRLARRQGRLLER